MSQVLGKKKLVRDISASTAQTIINQTFGLLIFYLTSRYLNKDDFGELNWSMAVGATVIAIGSLGLDLIFIKRVASGENVLEITGIHFFHTVITGALLCIAAYFIRLVFPSFSTQHPLFFLVFVNLAIANIANSFKLSLNGLEAYRKLALLALIVNICKLALIVALFITGDFGILNVILVFIGTSLVEFLLGYIFMNVSIRARIKPLLKVVEYKYFILESLPQLGVVLFDSALARVDWILLGIISTAAATAEYSFTYKVFELSKLPLLIIAPVLLTRFSKIFKQQGTISDKQLSDLRVFFRIEMFILMYIPLFLAVAWSPLVDYFTNNKYGAINEVNYRILAVCVPLHGIINFLWTLGFVRGQLKTIMFITIFISLLNIAANALMIPLYAATGASLAFLLCTILQLALYLIFIDHSALRINYGDPALTFIMAIVSMLVSLYVFNNLIFAAALAALIYTLFGILSQRRQLGQFRQIFRR
jgi:O-antigen/teichoic acid export membrane protein